MPMVAVIHFAAIVTVAVERVVPIRVAGGDHIQFCKAISVDL